MPALHLGQRNFLLFTSGVPMCVTGPLDALRSFFALINAAVMFKKARKTAASQ
jgi:hypothetical protein